MTFLTDWLLGSNRNTQPQAYSVGKTRDGWRWCRSDGTWSQLYPTEQQAHDAIERNQ